MKSGDDSSSSVSSSSSSSSDSEDESPKAKSKPAAIIQKAQPVTTTQAKTISTNEATLDDLLEIQFLRKDLCEHISSPFFEDMVIGSYVRVVYSNNQYRLCKAVGISQSANSYTVQSGAPSKKN
jgi:hypothetical protein